MQFYVDNGGYRCNSFVSHERVLKQFLSVCQPFLLEVTRQTENLKKVLAQDEILGKTQSKWLNGLSSPKIRSRGPVTSEKSKFTPGDNFLIGASKKTVKSISCCFNNLGYRAK
jgi:hypothetical protein